MEMTTNNHAKDSSGETDSTEESDWKAIGAAGLMRGDPPRRPLPTREHTETNASDLTSTLNAKELEAAAGLAALVRKGPDGKEGKPNGNGPANRVVNESSNGTANIGGAGNSGGAEPRKGKGTMDDVS